jgi:hypothetical protein
LNPKNGIEKIPGAAEFLRVTVEIEFLKLSPGNMIADVGPIWTVTHEGTISL